MCKRRRRIHGLYILERPVLKIDDFTSDSEDEVDAEENVAEEDEERDDEEYDDELSEGEGSEYLDEAEAAEEDLGASYMSQDSAVMSNPAGSILESVEGDLDIEEEAIGEEELTPVVENTQDRTGSPAISLPIRSKSPKNP